MTTEPERSLDHEQSDDSPHLLDCDCRQCEREDDMNEEAIQNWRHRYGLHGNWKLMESDCE